MVYDLSVVEIIHESNQQDILASSKFSTPKSKYNSSLSRIIDTIKNMLRKFRSAIQL